MRKKGLQLFTKEYLEYCKKLSPYQILKFLDEFRRLHAVSPRVLTKKDKKQT